MLCNVFVSSQPWLFSSILYNFFSNSWINFEAFYFLNIWRFVTILCYWFLISLYCHQKREFVCLWYLFIFSLCPKTWSSFIHSLYVCKQCIFSNCWVQGPLDPLYCLNLLCSYNILCVCFTSYLDVSLKKNIMMMMNLCISSWNSAKFCCIYFEAMLLGANHIMYGEMFLLLLRNDFF